LPKVECELIVGYHGRFTSSRGLDGVGVFQHDGLAPATASDTDMPRMVKSLSVSFQLLSDLKVSSQNLPPSTHYHWTIVYDYLHNFSFHDLLPLFFFLLCICLVYFSCI
jgi:hypothetical protein